MHLKSYKLWLILILLFSATQAHGAKRDSFLKVSTLNLKWFGIGGGMWNTPEMEYRQENLKRFTDEVLYDSDVIVFTEIVRHEALKEVIGHRMDCVSYERDSKRHQHVSICYDKEKFRTEKYDADYIIPEVDWGEKATDLLYKLNFVLKMVAALFNYSAFI